ncbi:MAG: D-glycero-beta-D-manno-heptose 1-phosphate adenylyltransferase [Verrucomicrobiota bacterium]|jgi:rfaE bifunctional protein nucleotidyltransferase chain/domain
MNDKILSVDELALRSTNYREREKKTLVLTNGCFDLVHVGHVRYLQAARALGDALAVAINGDDSVRALKGDGRPLNSENDRAEIIAALECVDHVVVFPEVRATGLLGKVKPAIYVKGGDYRPDTLNSEERAVLEKIGAEIRILPFEAGYSTSAVMAKLMNLCADG